MGSIIEKARKAGLIDEDEIPLHEFLGYDLKNPSDFLDYQKFCLKHKLHTHMLKKHISKAELARRLGVSRQAVANKFYHETPSFDWLAKAFMACHLRLDFKVTKPKAPKTTK